MHFEKLEKLLQEDGVVFLTYGGFLNQSIIAGMTDALEHRVKRNDLSVTISINIFTVFIELSQNMMKYCTSKELIDQNFDARGLIVVGKETDTESYYIISRNMVNTEDIKPIKDSLEAINGLDKDGLRKLYRELRRSGCGKHEKGAGIGFIEIARRCDKIEYDFIPVSDEKKYFIFQANINLEKGHA